MADDAFVQLDGALVFGKRGGISGEARDGVVAGIAASDLVRELAAAPVVDVQVAGVAEQRVELAQLVVDGRIFERGVEDVGRLILTRHALAILPLVWNAPRWLPERGESECGAPGMTRGAAFFTASNY